MFKIQTLNNISALGLERLPPSQYQVGADLQEPDALLVRSADLHKVEIPRTVKAIGRAGAGTNNIPVKAMSERGVPVFNAPGANANAVKELVLAGMFLAARNLIPAWSFTQALGGDEAAMHKAVEDGKKKFVGFELPGRTLGVIGLGAIGVKVANAAVELGMRAMGYDPSITVQNAWQLNAAVQQAVSIDDLIGRADLITVHVPLLDATKKMINAQRIKLMKKGATLLNFSREGVVDEAAVKAALDEGKLHAYVCDFPTPALVKHPRAVTLPHLGASTGEAEDNCAVMVAEQLRDFLENGNIRNAVNFPEAVLPPVSGATRLCIANANVPNMVGQITTALAKQQLNIADLLNKSRGELAYTLVDVDGAIPGTVCSEIAAIQGVLSVRALNNHP
ncbi:MAG TPA: phosphoglycerate dehydrogenase [Candidatus Binatia bacterium]|nr:phosphoglycerate dehydrogenase [Candidatus Binatia bacterium]